MEFFLKKLSWKSNTTRSENGAKFPTVVEPTDMNMNIHLTLIARHPRSRVGSFQKDLFTKKNNRNLQKQLVKRNRKQSCSWLPY
jgi:hypothetical protein